MHSLLIVLITASPEIIACSRVDRPFAFRAVAALAIWVDQSSSLSSLRMTLRRWCHSGGCMALQIVNLSRGY
jgi:hypothetical protein